MRHLPFILESPSGVILPPESPPDTPTFQSPTARLVPTLPSPPPRLPTARLLTTDVRIGSQSLGPFQLSAKTASIFHRALLIDKERWKGGGTGSVPSLGGSALGDLDAEIRMTTKTLLGQSLDWETKLDCFAMLVRYVAPTLT